MKISVSLPEEDVAFLDAQGGNRSSVVHQAVQLLRRNQLSQQYAEAFDEFEAAGEQKLWDGAAADGLQP